MTCIDEQCYATWSFLSLKPLVLTTWNVVQQAVSTYIQPVREALGGLYTDLFLYPYGGTSPNLSKIPTILGGIVIYCPR